MTLTLNEIIAVVIIGVMICLLAIHSGIYFVVRYTSIKQKPPSSWLITIALLLPIISHIVVYFMYKEPKPSEYVEEPPIIYDNSHLTSNTGFQCSRTKKDIYVGDTILFEEQLGAGTRIATCEATVRLDDTVDGYYVDGFFMDGGDRIPFQWKLLKDFYSNIRLI